MSKISDLIGKNLSWADHITQENPDFFNQLAEGQSPDYLWIGCADSRVPATQIVDLAPGDLFVHRNVANLIIHSDLNSQAVVQYAVEVLKVKHIIVCGHYGCGGVQAALQNQNLGLIDNWLLHIRDTFRRFKDEIEAISNEEERVNKLCERNVQAQVYHLANNTFVQKAWKNGQDLSVHGWIYSLKIGQIKDLDLTVSSADQASTAFDSES